MSAEIGGNKPTARRPAGEVQNPQLLYPSNETSRAKNKAGGKPVALDALKPGDTLGADEAPQIANSGFTLSCTVETTQPDAIIIAHGGSAAGYALHLRSGHIIFMIRYGGGESFTEVESPSTLSGSTKISASLAKDHTLTLIVNDQVVATARAPGLISRQPQEDFCVGFDNAKPVATYNAKVKFEGRISDLKITTP